MMSISDDWLATEAQWWSKGASGLKQSALVDLIFIVKWLAIDNPRLFHLKPVVDVSDAFFHTCLISIKHKFSLKTNGNSHYELYLTACNKPQQSEGSFPVTSIMHVADTVRPEAQQQHSHRSVSALSLLLSPAVTWHHLSQSADWLKLSASYSPVCTLHTAAFKWRHVESQRITKVGKYLCKM